MKPCCVNTTVLFIHTECPDGLQCSSTIPNHYKKFNHTLLAHSRANTAITSLSQQAEISLETSLSSDPGLINNGEDNSIVRASQGSVPSPSPLPSHSGSPHSNLTGTPPSKLTNGLLLLRSPTPDDFKKKKGWLSPVKGQRSLSSSQESTKEILSTPTQENIGSPIRDGRPKDEPFPKDDEAISFSPLSELPADTEVNNEIEVKKVGFNNDASENEDSMILFSDDELFAEFIGNSLEVSNVPAQDLSSTTQLISVSSLAPPNQVASSTLAKNRADLAGESEVSYQSVNNFNKTTIQSPQSIVLERLRESLSSSEGQCSKNLKRIQTEQPHTTSQVPPSLNSSVTRSQNMLPQKGPKMAGQASGLKQTDIGVFFGLKPLKEKEAESGPKDLDSSSIPTEGEKTRNRRRRDGQRKSKADKPTLELHGTETVNDGQGDAGLAGTRGWRRRRWNRGNADGEVELPRCPFYKKIPGQ